MSYEFTARSRFVPPQFFGAGGANIEVGDAVEVRSGDARIRLSVDALGGDGFAGKVQTIENDGGRHQSYEGIAVGADVLFREQDVRSCWKGGARPS
jgi:hypothetical protein